MPEKLTRAKRSELMSRVRVRDTAPEIRVRRLLHGLGYRFRLHRDDLPGKPDIVLPRHEKVVFVHGCFWHGHPGCSRAKRPATNREFWERKIDRNIARDKRVIRDLRKLGYRVLVVWECETRNTDRLLRKLRKFMAD